MESDREQDKSSSEKDKTRKRVSNPPSFEDKRSWHFIINTQLPIYPIPID